MNKLTLDEANLNAINSVYQRGELVILPTDTLYGLTAQALKPDAVEQVYKLKKRSPEKPFIILISDLKMLDLFGVKPTLKQNKLLSKVWPGQVSVILPCNIEKLEYLHRSTNSLAFRLPKDKILRDLISQTGPLIAPSANTEGNEPALTIQEAYRYFGEDVPLYIDAGVKQSQPSTLISLLNGNIEVLRGSLDPELLK